MAVRTTMAALIAKTRRMIADTSASPAFSDQDVQDQLDANRDDIRYEPLRIAPSIINNTNTGNQADTIFADFYSRFGYWESDLVLQANVGTAAWIVVTPLAMELLVDEAHFQFETNVFATGTAPGQLPPVFATGKVYDCSAAAADLCAYWAATLAGSYDITVDGQNLRRSQLMQSKLTMEAFHRRHSKPRSVKMIRNDIQPDLTSERATLMGSSINEMGA